MRVLNIILAFGLLISLGACSTFTRPLPFSKSSASIVDNGKPLYLNKHLGNQNSAEAVLSCHELVVEKGKATKHQKYKFGLADPKQECNVFLSGYDLKELQREAVKSDSGIAKGYVYAEISVKGEYKRCYSLPVKVDDNEQAITITPPSLSNKKDCRRSIYANPYS
ncbi:MAG: hypothetical protein OXR68_04200 [Alphaproteobacteria bacterium]|nr:hypothetical protein [Alphaproteobacteria bacterium]MDD9919809.1 hypothetical protein [Alphaproteobacteria bacterium]